MGKTVLFCEFWNVSPHLDGGLELAIDYALSGYCVKYIHLGASLPFCECYIRSDASSLSRESIALGYVNEYLQREYSRAIEVISLNSLPELPKTSGEDIISLEYDDMAELMRLRHRDNPIGQFLASNLSDLFNSSNLSPIEKQPTLQRMFESYLMTENALESLLLLHHIDLVFVFNGRYSYTRAVVDVCKRSKISVKFHERGCENATLLVRPHPPHEFTAIKNDIEYFWQKTINEQGITSAISLGRRWFGNRSKSGSAIIGDRVVAFKKSTENPDLQKTDRILISFFWSSADEYSWLPETMWPTGGWTEQRSAILDLVTACKIANLDAKIIVRLHPNLRYKHHLDQETARSISSLSNITVIDYDDSTSSYDLISASDIVFSCCSTISIEACAFKKPSVLMGRVFFEDLAPLIQVHNMTRLVNFLSSFANGRLSIDLSSLDYLKYGVYLSNRARQLKYFSPSSHISSVFEDRYKF